MRSPSKRGGSASIRSSIQRRRSASGMCMNSTPIEPQYQRRAASAVAGSAPSRTGCGSGGRRWSGSRSACRKPSRR